MDNIKIAISGESGCGNTTLCKALKDKLGLKMVNYTLRDMAKENGVTLEVMQELAKKDDKIDKELDRRILEFAQDGNVVVGSRLAIWLIKDADLKIYLEAPLEIRARRIHSREKGLLENVLQKTWKRDEENRLRYKRIYDIDIQKRGFAISINSAKYSTESIANSIVKYIKLKEKIKDIRLKSNEAKEEILNLVNSDFLNEYALLKTKKLRNFLNDLSETIDLVKNTSLVFTKKHLKAVLKNMVKDIDKLFRPDNKEKQESITSLLGKIEKKIENLE